MEGEKRTVTMWSWFDKNKLIPAFHESYPDIEVEFVKFNSSADVATKVQMAVASGGELPDICLLYTSKDAWYYLGDDGAMCTGQVTVDGKWYIMDNAGRMIVEPVTLTPDRDGALRWPGLAE